MTKFVFEVPLFVKLFVDMTGRNSFSKPLGKIPGDGQGWNEKTKYLNMSCGSVWKRDDRI